MTLWVVLALMTAAAVLVVLWPLARGERKLRSGSDLAVYRDQLEEIQRDRSAGLIGEAEAEAARVEVSRRLIGAADAEVKSPAVTAGWNRRVVPIIALLLLPIGAGAFYLVIGSPELPGQPFAARNADSNQGLDHLIAQVE